MPLNTLLKRPHQNTVGFIEIVIVGFIEGDRPVTGTVRTVVQQCVGYRYRYMQQYHRARYLAS